MIQPFDSMKFSQYTLITLLKFILLLKDLCWYRVQKLSKPVQVQEHNSSSYHHLRLQDHQDSADEAYNLPSPSLVPVPIFMSQVVSTLIKTKLPAVEFGRSKLLASINKNIGAEAELSAVCAICLASIEGSEEIRELVNCSHVYHRDCIDGWVDEGHGTCPLCRIKLLSLEADEKEAEDVKGEYYDPWRSERIAYLFGEDHLFDTF